MRGFALMPPLRRQSAVTWKPAEPGLPGWPDRSGAPTA